MNQEHYDILKNQGVEAWNKWRDKNPDIKPDLSGADLSGTDIRNANLMEADLRNADLSGADMTPYKVYVEENGEPLQIYTNLIRTDFEGANFKDAVGIPDFITAGLTNNVYSKEKLVKSIKGNKIKDLNYVNLENAYLGSVDLSGASLCCANLSRAMFNDANLSGADLSDAILNNANFGGADLRNAILSYAKFRKAILSGANLSKTDLLKDFSSYVNFSGADLSKTDLSNRYLSGAKFNKTDLSGAKLNGTDLKKANLSGANLTDAKLQGAKFNLCAVDGSTIISNCEIDRDTDFRGVGLDSIRIDSGIKELLKYNIRRKNWEDWYKEDNILKWFVKPFWLISDYGRSTGRLLVTFFISSFFFAVLYSCYPNIINGLKQEKLQFLRSFYFSIVTMTTLGFGDMYAAPGSFWGYILLMLQVLLGYVLLGALITRLSILFTAEGPSGKFTPDTEKNGILLAISAFLKKSLLSVKFTPNTEKNIILLATSVFLLSFISVFFILLACYPDKTLLEIIAQLSQSVCNFR